MRNTSPEFMCKEVSSTSDDADTSTDREPVNSSPIPAPKTTPTRPQQSKTTTNTTVPQPISVQTELQVSDVTKSKSTPPSVAAPSAPESAAAVSAKKVCICKICRKEFNDLRAAASHLTRNHYIEIELQCPHCAQKWKSTQAQELQRHGPLSHPTAAQPVQFTIVGQSSYIRTKHVLEDSTSGRKEAVKDGGGQTGSGPKIRTSPRSGRIIGAQLGGSNITQDSTLFPRKGSLYTLSFKSIQYT